MITPNQIEEWIHEVEQRPASAALIIQYISRRLQDLTARNEELLAENIELRSGRKVDEYEKRIAMLEYQVELLKRQLGDAALSQPAASASETICIIAYTIDGQVLRLDLGREEAISGSIAAMFRERPSLDRLPRIIVTNPQEELVFVFNSGRTITSPVTSIPPADKQHLSWDQSVLIEPRGEEELSAVLAIAKMSLFDYCLQTSRKGCLKKIVISSFENHLKNEYIGSGVKQKLDRTFSLILSGKDDSIVVASREGYLLSKPVLQAAYTAEEIIKLSPTDYLVSAFACGKKPALLVITNKGKVINREMSWLDSSDSGKQRGQPVFSAARREAGARVAGAFAAEAEDFCILLCSNGKIMLYQVSELLAAGSIGALEDSDEVLDAAVISLSI